MSTKPTCLIFISEINMFSFSVSLMSLVPSEPWFSARNVLSSKKPWPWSRRVYQSETNFLSDFLKNHSNYFIFTLHDGHRLDAQRC